MLMIGIAIALGILLGVLALVSLTGDRDLVDQAEPDFLRAADAEGDSAAGKWLIKVSRPLAGLPYTNLDVESPGYKSLRYKIAATGGLFAGSVTVYLSVQIAAGIISTMLLAIALFSGLSGLALGGAIAFSLAFALWPYQRMVSAGKKRQEEVNRSLPEFAELLLMPLSSGYGILPSLAFTADRVKGPVSREVQLLLEIIATRSQSEAQAFEEAGARLGTPEAIAFFNTLAQAYLEGTAAVEVLRGQAVQLRKIAYEQTRAKIKLLPTKLILVIGIHLMPTLFVVTLVPIGFQLMQGLGGR